MKESTKTGCKWREGKEQEVSFYRRLKPNLLVLHGPAESVRRTNAREQGIETTHWTRANAATAATPRPPPIKPRSTAVEFFRTQSDASASRGVRVKNVKVR